MSEVDRARRTTELSLTVLTLVLLVMSATAGQIGVPPQFEIFLDLGVYLAGGWVAVREAFPKLLRGTLDVDFLMVFAAIGAASIGAWHEGGVLLFLFSLSNTLQVYAMDRSRRAIGRLLQQRPQHAMVLREGMETRTAIEDLAIGDVMVIRPGEMLPTDGVIRSGQSEMNESSITGESRPIDKGPGDSAYAGSLNGTGSLEVEVTRLAQDSTLARIVQMVESAQSYKARTQRFLERAEGFYALGILVAVVLLVIIPWAFLGTPVSAAFYRAMVLLVVASPCALVVSTPAAILSAIAGAARQGILFKGGVYLENMADVKVAVFDKTGTLTTGKPGVTDVICAEGAPHGFEPAQLLAYAAALESRSEHPLAREIMRAARDRGVSMPAMSNFVALPGRGLHATLGGYEVWIGGDRLYEEHGEIIPRDLLEAKCRLEAEGKTALILHRELGRRNGRGDHEYRGGWLGIIGMADTIRPGVPEVVRNLRRLGITRTVMLTGDNEQVARTIAEHAGIDEYHASLLPEEKVRLLREVQQRYGAVMMLGDGVNDAPALANASVGVAMGGAGTDVTLESAHCVLMGDDLSRIVHARALSRRAVRTVAVNLAFSAVVIVALITAAFTVALPLPVGVLGHEGSTVLVCLNGLRLLRSGA
jgi:Cd2+/Zn2+-exporting ATPase